MPAACIVGPIASYRRLWAATACATVPQSLPVSCHFRGCKSAAVQDCKWHYIKWASFNTFTFRKLHRMLHVDVAQMKSNRVHAVVLSSSKWTTDRAITWRVLYVVPSSVGCAWRRSPTCITSGLTCTTCLLHLLWQLCDFFYMLETCRIC